MIGLEKDSNPSGKAEGVIGRFLSWFKVSSRDRRRLALGVFVSGFIFGLTFLGGYHATVNWTNTDAFCVSCHSMEANAFTEYKQSSHYKSASGMRVSCADCHVPKAFGPELLRKVLASRDLYHHFIGTIDTKAKYEERRLAMAQTVWDYMGQSDSRECRHCHDPQLMKKEDQLLRTREGHEQMVEEGLTCIDCHKGFAHRLPEGYVNQFGEERN